jgi:hypothetical protein
VWRLYCEPMRIIAYMHCEPTRISAYMH